MCGLDNLFHSTSLHEETGTAERLIQALDERGATGVFRQLIEKQFLESWPNELGPIEKIEDALNRAREFASLPDKISAFVQSIAGNTPDGWLHQNFNLKPVGPIRQLLQHHEKRFSGRIAFSRKVATQVFSETPYGFYQCFKPEHSSFVGFLLFYAPAYYDKPCHLTSLLFNDQQQFEGEGAARNEILWSIFEYMAQGSNTFSYSLMELFRCDSLANVPTLEIHLFAEAFDYLCAWLEADAQSRDYSYSSGIFAQIEGFVWERESEILSLTENRIGGELSPDDWEAFKAWAKKWLDEKRHALKKAWCCNVNLEGLSDEEFKVWALRSYECYLPLCIDLSEERVARLLAWGIEEDLKKWLDSKNDRLLDSSMRSGVWYVSVYREAWRSQFIESLNTLPVAERLSVCELRIWGDIRVSSCRLPQYVTLPDGFSKEDEYGIYYEFHVDEADCAWWNSLLRSLPGADDFPKELLPSWTLTALSRFGYSEALASFADKSLGNIRGSLGAGEVELTADDIGRLINILERFCPEKAIRHRLMLLRNSLQPYATENLDNDRSSLCPCSMSEILNGMAHSYIAETRERSLSVEEWKNEEQQFLSSVRGWVAQFCLSRLKLRKGEKAGKDGYKPEQVVESSAVWRKAYVKALEELGVDLQGKVHKTINFTRKSDPAEDVREVAKTCYKAVRREHNKSEVSDDIRRGLAAAYWWLLLAQRHSLGLPINEEEAVKTRRRLLRRP